MKYTDFIPPIVIKVIQRIKLILRIGDFRIHPFENIPKDMQPKWFLDVGANVGDVSEAALISYPQCRVICFEPVNATFEMLKKRLAVYGDRVILINEALSDKNGTCEINITSFHGANSISLQSDFHKDLNPHVYEIGKETISIARLDDMAKRIGDKKIDVMKIDVEGHELNVLKGGIDFIKDRVDTIIIEMSLMRDQSWEEQSVAKIFTLLDSLGFKLINLFDIHHAYQSGDKNLMCAQVDCVFRHKKNLK
jgi:FkbM family methyltransferase